MATEAARLERKESTGRKKKKEKNTLDSYRPSHGRHLTAVWFVLWPVRTVTYVAGSDILNSGGGGGI